LDQRIDVSFDVQGVYGGVDGSVESLDIGEGLVGQMMRLEIVPDKTLRNDAQHADLPDREPGANLKKQEKNNSRGRILGSAPFSKRCIRDTPG
jgi:hypothetical protein